MLNKNSIKTYAVFARSLRSTSRDLSGVVFQNENFYILKDQVRLFPVKPISIDYKKELSEKDEKEISEYKEKLISCLHEEIKKMNKIHPEFEFFVARMNGKKCPVKINWKSRNGDICFFSEK